MVIHPPLLYMGYVGFSVASPSPSPRCSAATSTRLGALVAPLDHGGLGSS
jgi:cytochrome c biogenesis factor